MHRVLNQRAIKNFTTIKRKMSETDPEANSEKMKKHNKFDFPADS